ncbi:MAG: HPF/RaiA family ribosome-associated protein [SAR324 cluster bacterium]|nr:HPF/RaiA family ribosome-associated protein [SAR324 cluster bacterium]
MTIHITFNNMKHSESVTEHVHEIMKELIKITDNKFPFSMNLTKENDQQHHVVLNCSYMGKDLSSNASHENLYKAIGKTVDSMKTQVLRKSKKTYRK